MGIDDIIQAGAKAAEDAVDVTDKSAARVGSRGIDESSLFRLRRQLERLSESAVNLSRTDDGVMLDFQMSSPLNDVQRSAVIVDEGTGKVSSAAFRLDPKSSLDRYDNESEAIVWNAAEGLADDLGVDAKVTGHVGYAGAPIC